MARVTVLLTAPASANPPLAEASSAYAWFVVCALSFANMVSYLERQIVTLMFGPIKATLHLSDTQISLLTGLAFSLFAAVFGLYFGRLADRKNRKWIVTLGAVAWSFATMCCGLAGSFWQLFSARVGVGIGESTLNSSGMSMITDYFSRKRLARALSVYSSSVSLGAGLALVLGGAIIHFVGGLSPLNLPYVGQLSTWQMTFVFVGAFGSIAIVPMLFVKEPVRRGALTNSTEALKTGVPLRVVLSFLLRHRRFYLCHVAGFSLATASTMGMLTWTPSFFIRIHHWTPLHIGSLYGSSLAVVGTIGVLLGARVSEWMDSLGFADSNMRLPAYALALAAIPATAAYLVPSGNWAIGLILISQLIGSLSAAPLIAALQLVTPNEMRGQIMAMFAFIAGIVGQAIGPLIVAVFTDYLYRSEIDVGWSMVTTIVLLNPMVLYFFLRSLAPYRAGLDEAASRAGNAPAANI